HTRRHHRRCPYNYTQPRVEGGGQVCPVHLRRASAGCLIRPHRQLLPSEWSCPAIETPKSVTAPCVVALRGPVAGRNFQSTAPSASQRSPVPDRLVSSRT